MSDSLILDPELEGLLREVAADPRSTLLRVPRHPIPPGVFDHDPRVTTMAAGLTAAERHLLQAHRAELALLLRQGALVVLDHAPGTSRWLDKFVSDNQRLELPDLGHWERRTREAMERAATVSPSGFDVVSSCVVRLPMACTATELAMASLRLWPTDEARTYIALDLYRSRNLATALRVYRSILNGMPTPMVRCCALQNTALAFSDLGQVAQAADASERAAVVPVDILEPTLNAQFHAMNLGDRARIVRAAARVDELVPEDSPVLNLFIRQLREQREQGDWSLAEKEQAVRASRLGFGVSSMKVADATLQLA